ncbi:unnamed protein product [Dicrocoelium dendriticum]|nr:unnamed protein product [Dicrocoelium dendriticum]
MATNARPTYTIPHTSCAPPRHNTHWPAPPTATRTRLSAPSQHPPSVPPTDTPVAGGAQLPAPPPHLSPTNTPSPQPTRTRPRQLTRSTNPTTNEPHQTDPHTPSNSHSAGPPRATPPPPPSTRPLPTRRGGTLPPTADGPPPGPRALHHGPHSSSRQRPAYQST